MNFKPEVKKLTLSYLHMQCNFLFAHRQAVRRALHLKQPDGLWLAPLLARALHTAVICFVAHRKVSGKQGQSLKNYNFEHSAQQQFGAVSEPEGSASA